MSALWKAGGLGQFERLFGFDLNRSRKDSAALSHPLGPSSRHLENVRLHWRKIALPSFS